MHSVEDKVTSQDATFAIVKAVKKRKTEKPLAIRGTFEDVIKLAVKDAKPKPSKKPKK